jgi:(2Fe-2S) ferredoxin
MTAAWQLSTLNSQPSTISIPWPGVAVRRLQTTHASDLAADHWPLTSASAYSTLTTLQRKRYLFVCINRRAEDNPKGCCAAKNSEEVYRALKGEVAARGLAKLEARVCTSSCLDQCATGVTVLVEPDHFFYGRVTAADVPEIVDGLSKGRPVNRLVITAE